jgi:hypothetical protein
MGPAGSSASDTGPPEPDDQELATAAAAIRIWTDPTTLSWPPGGGRAVTVTLGFWIHPALRRPRRRKRDN